MAKQVLTFMFHRVDCTQTRCCPKQFAKYLDYLVNHFPIVTPDDPLDAALSVCLTFDDAYYDFYHHVFPLLQRYQIKAILAVPTHYILADTPLDAKVRLSVPYPQGMQTPLYQQKAPFCTWKEIKEMADSPWVQIASHSVSHANLAHPQTNIEQEVMLSQQILEQHLNRKIRYFVYPYGKMTRTVHHYVQQHYDYGIRIGSAINYGWDQKNRHLYRVDADALWKANIPISRLFIHKISLKYWANRLRAK